MTALRTCPECGQLFEPRDAFGQPGQIAGQGIIGGSNQKYCSTACRVRARNRLMYQRRKARKPPPPTTT